MLGGRDPGGGQKPNHWTPFVWEVIKEARKSVHDYGLQNPFTQSFIDNIFGSNILCLYDCQQLMQLLITGMQYILWKSKWTDLCQQAAVANLYRDDGDPLKYASVEMLTGTGTFIDAQVQNRMNVQILHQSAHAAREALRQMPEDGKIVLPFTKVAQGPTETYMSFLDRL